MLENILMILFTTAFLIQVYHYLIIYSEMIHHKSAMGKGSTAGVSVIIAARNEIENLRNNLPLFFGQDYPRFEVIVVNDRSWDDSKYFLSDLKKIHQNLKVVEVEEIKNFKQGKKFALTLGIKAAEYDLLLISDADCVPASPQWIKETVNHYLPETEIVLGYGAYQRRPGMLNKFIRMDTCFTAMQYFSAAIQGKPYMGVGRNLSYKKELFLRNKGFASHNHIMAGDDDLFINEVANKNNTEVMLKPETFTLSEPELSWMGWINQKKRHLSVGVYYKVKDKMALGLSAITNILIYVSAICLLLVNFYPLIVVTALVMKQVIQIVVTYGCLRRLKETDLLIYVPVYDLFAAFFYPSITISNLLIKRNKW